MQIEEKYKKDYENALVKLRKTREEFIKALSTIPNLRVIPSQANYVMCELLGNHRSKEITKSLLIKYNLFIKDLQPKLGEGKEYIRLAVRTEEENSYLVNTLKLLLS